MYQAHFHLDKEPFSIAPDPSFLYLSEGHNEALAHLMYGLSHGGFVLLTGEVGTGKTTLLRDLIRHTPNELDVAFILNPRLTVKELLETICDELGVVHDKEALKSVKQYIDVLNKHLLATHREDRSTVVIIDEAQNLSPAVLEQIRLLTNLETDERKLLRIILLGQPELDEVLARKELRQLAQRITARYYLGALSREDADAYVAHRLVRAGGSPNVFSDAALRALHRHAKGIPRVINIIADRAMLGAYTAGLHQVTAPIVKAAAEEIAGPQKPNRYPWLAGGLIGAALIAMFAAVAFDAYYRPSNAAPPPEPAPAVPEATAPTSQPPPPAERPAARVPTTAEAEADGAPTEADADASAAQTADIEPSEPIAAARSASPEPSATEQPTSSPPARTPDDDRASVPAAAVSLPDDFERPERSRFETHREAYTELFARWGVTYDPNGGKIPCDFAPDVGLQCLSRSGGWDVLAAVDRPAVLTFDDGNEAFYGAAISLTEFELDLVLDGRTLPVTRETLGPMWPGKFVVLWRMPPYYQGSVVPGQTHASVPWLRDQMATILGRDLATPTPDAFDPALESAVRTFQSRNGLTVDGIVGPMTWIRVADSVGGAEGTTPKLVN